MSNDVEHLIVSGCLEVGGDRIEPGIRGPGRACWPR